MAMHAQIKLKERDPDVLVQTLFQEQVWVLPETETVPQRERQRNDLCIIVPAYNEEESLPFVLTSIRKIAPRADIVVVNDASRDRTSRIARSFGVPVLDLPINLGIGGAVQTGLKYAVRMGYLFAMQVDGDGQHDTVYIPQLLEQLVEDRADMVIGSRFLHKKGLRSSPMRMIGIKTFSWLIGVVTDRWIYDPTSGFRAYNREAMEFAAETYPSDFPEPESIVTMLRNGFRVKEVPVEMRKRVGGRSSIRHDFSFRAWYFVVSNSIAILVSAFKRRSRI